MKYCAVAPVTCKKNCYGQGFMAIKTAYTVSLKDAGLKDIAVSCQQNNFVLKQNINNKMKADIVWVIHVINIKKTPTKQRVNYNLKITFFRLDKPLIKVKACDKQEDKLYGVLAAYFNKTELSPK